MKWAFLLFIGMALCGGGAVLAAEGPDPSAMNRRILEAVTILELKQGSKSPIPQRVLDHAKGVAIIEMTKGGIGIGASHGDGIIVARTGKGWSAPSAFSQGGGSVGLQLGVEIKRLIYVLNTQEAVDSFAKDDRFKFDAKANATAGPQYVEEDAAASPAYAIYIYASSEGAFAGATIGGQVMTTDREINQKVYGPSFTTYEILRGKSKAPDLAKRLYALLNGKSK